MNSLLNRDELRQKYSEGVSLIDIAEFYGKSYSGIENYTVRLCEDLRQERKTSIRAFPRCNRDFFVNDSSELYYFIGYVFGDGCVEVHKRGLNQVTVTSTDKDRILLFQDWIQSNQKLQEKKDKRGGKDCYVLRIVDIIAVNKIESYGIVPRKSTEGVAPQNISDKHFWPFFCGLIDSDGSIFISNSGSKTIEFSGYELLVSYVSAVLKNKRVEHSIRQDRSVVKIAIYNGGSGIAKVWPNVKDFNFKLRRKWDHLLH